MKHLPISPNRTPALGWLRLGASHANSCSKAQQPISSKKILPPRTYWSTSTGSRSALLTALLTAFVILGAGRVWAQAPGGVTGEAWWFKGDAGFTPGATTTWTDASSNGLNVSQATATKQPTSTKLQNFNPVVTFTGNNALVNAAGYWKTSTANTAYNVYAMTTHTTGTGSVNALFDETVSTGEQTVFADYNGANTYSGIWSSHYVYTPLAAAQSGVPTLLSMRYNNVGSVKTIAFNAKDQPVTNGGAVATFDGSSKNLVLGNNVDLGSWPFVGDIAEMVMYPSDVAGTGTSKQQIESYLALKWGTTLDQTTPTSYLSSAGSPVWNANATYKNNIAGLGRDDIAGLNQKQSQSVNSGSQVVMSAGTVAATNAANAATIAGNLQFNMWGDDGLAGQSALITFGPGLNQRLTKTWKLQQTGGYTNATTLYYPAAALAAFNNPQLLFTTAATPTPINNAALSANTTTINGTAYYAVTLPAGTTFFSFGGFKVDPGGIAGEAWWYKGDVGFTPGATTTWTDASSNSLDVTQTLATKQPTSTKLQNFNPVVTFTGNNALINATGFWKTSTANTAYNVYAMTTHTANTGSVNALFNERVSTGDQTVFADYGANVYSGMWGGINANTPFTTALSGIPTLLSTRYNIGGNTQTIAFNSKGQTVNPNGIATTFNGNGNSSNGNKSPLVLGNNVDGAQWPFVGDIAEMVMYPSDVAGTGTNKQQIESYLALKWGTTLDQTTPTSYLSSNGTPVWDVATNATYKNNIAGLGRDDIAGLNQKQSQSVNSGSQVVMSAGTVAATNAANAATIAGNLQFNMWGDDGLAGQSALITFGPGLNQRLTKTWKLQQTGGYTNATTLYYPAAALAAFNNPQLLFTTAATPAPINNAALSANTTTINGTAYYAVTLPAGTTFFSFGGFKVDPGGIAGEAWWYKGDAGFTPGATTTWTDASSNSLDVTQTLATKQPTSTKLQNFNPVVTFTGNNALINATGFWKTSTANTAYNVYAMTTHTANTGSVNALFNERVSTGDQTVFADYGANVYSGMWGGINANTPFTTALSGIPTLLSTRYNIGGNTQTIAFNSKGQTVNPNGIATTFNGNGNSSNGNKSPLVLGNNVDGAQWPFVGDIAEMVMYPSDVAGTGTNKQQIESYLALKWGTTLDQTTPTSYLSSNGSPVWNANATYKNNIAGLGRDDVAGLNQKQSQSVNSGSQVVMSAGTVAATNTANAATIAGNLQFNMWGDDGLAGQSALTTFGPDLNQRLTKTWKLQQTGGYTNATTLYYPAAALAAFSNPQLLFTTAATPTPINNAALSANTTTINGTAYYAVTLPAGTTFFSFGGFKVDPGGIAGEAWWFKGDAGFTPGATTTWTDASSNSLDVTQTLATKQPTSTKLQNFNPVVTFNGNNALINATGFWKTSTANTAYNVYAMTTHTANTGSVNALFNERVSTGDQTVFADYGANVHSGMWGGINANTPFTTALSGIPTLLSTRYNIGGNTQTIAFNSKGQTVNPNGTATTFNGNGNSSNGNKSPLGLGANADGAQWFFTGDIAEIVMYPSDVAGTGTSKQQIESYLALKWGTTLDQTTPTSYLSSNGTPVWDVATNATYKNNIAGLGRDDAAGLNQKQSQSVNKGNQVVMSTGTIAATNAANGTTITNNLQYNVWGDDGLVDFAKLTTFGPGINQRLAKTWKLQQTGGYANATTLYYPVSGLSLLTNPQFLYTTATTSTPTNTVALNTTTINGVAYYTVALPAGTTFFSFGGFIIIPGGITPNKTIPGTSFAIYIDGGADYSTSVASLATWGTGGTINSTPIAYGISDHMEDNLGYTGNNLGSAKYPIFGAEFNATLNVPVSDTYTFLFVNIDDEVQLTLDGIIQYTNGIAHTDGTYAVALSAGPHAIRVKYGSYTSIAHLEVRWSGTNAATAGTASANGTGPIPGTAIPGTTSTMLDNRWLTTTGTLAQWLRADAGISAANGATMTAWADQSLQGNDGGVGTNATYQNDAANVLNFNPVVKFAAGTEAQATTNGFPYQGQARTVFGVAERNGNGSAIQTYGTNTANNLSALSNFNGTQAGMDTGNGIAGTGFTWTAGVAALSSYEVSFAANKINSRVNGGTATSSTTVPQTSIANLPNLARIGGNEAAGTTHTGRIPELITFPWELTPTERFQVDSYLAVKYGITLAAHNYLATDGTTTTYNISTYGNNIAGIGRDDATALLQKQSQSVNSGNQVVMSAGTVAATNAANAATIAGNLQFNMWGDDGLAGQSALTTFGPDLNQRLTKTWKLQQTGGYTNATTLYYPAAALAAFSNRQLLFTTAATPAPTNNAALSANTTTINGTAYYAVTLPAGTTFFTFGGFKVDPGGIAGEAWWFKGDAGFTPGATTTWTDASNNSLNVSQATATKQPTSTKLQNFNPVVTFTGNNALVNAAGYWKTSTANTAYNVYAMTTHTTGTGSVNALFDETVSTGEQTVFADYNGANTHSGIWSSHYVYTPFAAAQNGVPTLLSMRYNNVGSVKTIAFNAKDQPVTNGGAVATFDGSSKNLVLGNNVDLGSWPFVGDIAEMVMYPSDVAGTGTSKQQIESYLALKWGTTLDQTTPTSYLSSAGSPVWNANATYKNNIAGLGRDDVAGLNQKQSQSVNAGSQGNIITMGLSSIAGTNTSNAATFGTDKTFEIWGNDNGAANYGTAYAATPNFNLRLTRVWSLQETGTVGSVRLAVPTTMLAGGQLVVSNNTALTSPTVFSATGTQTINGVATSYFDVDFPTGATSYFSFATKVVVPGGITPTNNALPGTSFAIYIDGGADYSTSVASLATWGTGGTINSTPIAYGISDHMEDNLGYTGNNLGSAKYPIFGAEFNATLNVPVSDTYTFLFVNIDDEVQLTLDGIIQYTNGITHTDGTYAVALSAGPHAIRVKYGSYIQVAHLEVRWSGTNAATAGTASANGTGPIPGTAIPGTTSTMLDNRWLTTTGTLAQWLRADAGISAANGATMTAWADQSLQGNDGGVGTNATYQNDAANVLNFNPVVKFAAGTEAQATTNGFPYQGQARTVFGVAERNGNGSAIQTYGTNTANNLSALSNFNGTQAGMDTGNGIAGTGFNWTAGVAALSSYEVSFAANKINSRVNGGTATSSTTVPQTSIANLPNLARIGGNEAAGTTHTGRIPELITFPWELTPTERFQVDSYLAVKYGITLAAHNYLATDGTTTTYNISTYGNNIAGIGRDDATALLQKQSQSVNSGNQVVMSAGTVAATNAANAATIAGNLQFNMWGDDGLAGQSALTTFGPDLNQRLTKTWKLQQTGGYTNATTLYYPAAALAAFSNPQLLFTTAATPAPINNAALSANTTTINGTAYYAVTLPAGTTFFTFGGFKVDPGGIAGEAWWFKGDAGFTPGATTTWTDASNNSLNVSQATATKQPTSTKLQNFNPVVTFNGANALGNAAGYWKTSKTNTAYNVYAMTTHTISTGSVNALFHEAVSGGEQTLFNDWNSTINSGLFNSNNISKPFTPALSGVPTLFSTRYNNAGTIKTIALNAKDQLVSNNGGAATFDGSNTALGIGANATQNDWFFTGDIAEIVMYPTDVASSPTSKQQIESYLALKWGTTLDQTTPTSYLSSNGSPIWNATANATYKNNIAGLGRDDAAGLNQKQSQSVNAGSQGNIITMGLSSIAGTNTSNAATFGTDKTFEIWGNDNGAANYGTAYAATPNFNLRLTRVWSLQETGTVGSVRLAVPTAVLAGGQLVVSNNTALTSPTVFSATGTQTINGVATSYFDVDFPTGTTSYFSFATKVAVPGGVPPANNTLPGTSFAIYIGGGADYSNPVASLATWGTGGTINSTPIAYGISDHMEDNLGYTGNTLGSAKYPIFGAEFNATLNVPVSDTYTFLFVNIDDEVQLTLDGIIQYTNIYATSTYAVALSAGPHAIRVKYGSYTGIAHLEVRWSGTNAATAGTASANGTGPIPGTAIPGTTSTMLDNRWLTTTGTLAQWLRADAGISAANGATMTAWADQGLQGNDGGVGTNATYQNDAANVLNFNPVVKFAAGTEAQATTNGFPYQGQARTVFGVAERNGNGSAIQTYGTNTANNLSALSNFNGTQAGMDTGNGIAGTGFNWTAGVAALSSYEVSFAANKINSRVNGGTATSSTTVPQTSIANLPNLARIGGNEAAGTTYTGRIPELITFPWELTQTERFQVDSYLAVKYGITLAAHNYLATDGTTTTYNISTYGNNIAGIGRDDATALLQKQSQSQNTANRGNLVTMGLSRVATTNALNSGAITADKSFNIWGDDKGSVTTTTTTNLPTGSTCAARLPRQWKVQRTNAGVGAVQVQIDLTSTVRIVGLIGQDFVLLIDRDGDGDFTTGSVISVPAVSYANNQVTFNNVTWDSDGNGSDVFALVVNNVSVSPPPLLLANNNTVLAPIATCKSADGGLQFVNTLSSPTQKFMQINPNGNTGYDFGAGITALNNNPLINNQMKTDGATATTALANRMYTAHTNGTFTTNGGMLVRIYYDPADLTAAENALDPTVPGTSNSQWFKFEGSAAQALAAQTARNFSSAVTYLTPSTTGSENGVNYVEFANITSFSTFGFQAGRSSGPAPLPVTLTRFTATRQAADGLLQWETASETNSDFFELQASPSGTNWQVLTSLPAQGNSNAARAYTFVDHNLARYNTSLVYYRLRMVDRDASARYSPVRALAVAPGQWSINAYPNPFSGQLNLQLNTPQTEPVSVILYDAIGKVVLRYEQATTQIGSQLLDLHQLPALSTGLYVLRVTQGTHNETVRVIKE